MITPVRTMTINQIVERKDELLMSDDDIKELARNERAKAIDEFAERIKAHYKKFRCVPSVELVMEIAEQMKTN